MIEVRGLIYEYPGLRALDRVSFSVREGTITALVGPNGAGKTTLMRCIAGMDRPLAGEIEVDGVSVVDEPRRSHRALGYLSDFFGLYDDLTVRQSLSYVAAANGIPEHDAGAVVRRTAAELGLEDRLEQRSGDLSRGLRQRVAIAHAIIHGPRVVVLDEPASGLDPEARYELGELFQALRARGMTLLVSSHILSELEAYSTHMLILREGRIIDHRAVGEAEGETVAMQVRTLDDQASLQGLLDGDPRASAVEVADGVCRFAYEGDEAARAALLRRLLEAGVQVTEFAMVSEDLQQSYLRSIAAHGSSDES